VDTRTASTDVVAAEPAVVLLLRHSVLRSRLDSDTAYAARCYRGLAILLANRLRETTVGATDLDETMLDGMARAGERFRLLREYLEGRLA
jgi:CRP/FNR family cyclic AMP-dependent transcriptional regulator